MEEKMIEDIKYSDIEKANKEIHYMTLKRKNNKTNKVVSKKYAEVHERVKAFRKVYPNGVITTVIEKEDEKSVRMLSTITDKYGNTIATARASEVKNGLINATSMIENCETSAVGRALGFAGFGVDTAIASVEEIQKVDERKNPVDNMPIQKGQKQWLEMNCTEEEIAIALKNLKKNKLDDLTFDEAEYLRDFKEKRQDKHAKEEGDVF